MSSMHKTYDAQLLATAEEALDNLPDDAAEETVAARTQLLNWLVNIDRNFRNPASIANDTMADVACNALEDAVNSREDEAFSTVGDAFKQLGDDEQLNLMRYILGAVFAKCASGGALMTRQSDGYMWDHTGFHIDGDLKTAFAKLGQNSYQAIGFDDGEHYIGTEGSKTLWTREFAIGIMLPFVPPFKVEKKEIAATEVSTETELSDNERTKITELLEMFDKDLVDRAECGEDGIAEKDDMIREGITLARIRIPRLDTMLDKAEAEHDELGPNLENVPVVDLVHSCSEFLRMKLDDDTVRRDIEATVIAAGSPDEAREQLLQTLRRGLEERLPPEGATMEESAADQITQACQVVPALKDVVAEYEDKPLVEAYKAVIDWIDKELEALV